MHVYLHISDIIQVTGTCRYTCAGHAQVTGQAPKTTGTCVTDPGQPGSGLVKILMTFALD